MVCFYLWLREFCVFFLILFVFVYVVTAFLWLYSLPVRVLLLFVLVLSVFMVSFLRPYDWELVCLWFISRIVGGIALVVSA